MGLTDRAGIVSIKMFSHVKIVNPRHARYTQTGTVVRIDLDKRKVWVSFPGGSVNGMSHRSVEVIVPQSSR